MGMFGGIKAALAKGRDPGSDGISFFDRLYAAGGIAQGDQSAAMELRKFARERVEKARKDAAMADLLSAFGPQVQTTPTPDVSVSRMPQMTPPAPIDSLAMSRPQMPQAAPPPPAQVSAGISDYGDPRLMTLLNRATMAGIPLTAQMELLKNRSKKSYEQGVQYGDYASDNPAFIPKQIEGAQPSFGPNGSVSMRPIEGAQNVAAGMAGAVTGAQEQAKASWDLVTVPIGGRTVMLPRAVAAPLLTRQFGGQADLPNDFGRTRAPEDAAAAQALAVARANAQGDVEAGRTARRAAIPAQVDALDNMERLLPDVISGFGADARLQAARMLAATGNEDAKRKVAATETFINQGRILVANIIKTFGSNPTEGERKFAERMSGADAQLNPETLKEGIRLQRARIARDVGDQPAQSGGQWTPEQARAELARRRAGAR